MVSLKIELYIQDRSTSLFIVNKDILSDIKEWKDIVEDGKIITKFNLPQLQLIVAYLQDNVINNGDISDQDILDLILKCINIKRFEQLVGVLWYDLFDCAESEDTIEYHHFDMDLFYKLPNPLLINLLRIKCVYEFLMRLDSIKMKKIPSFFIVFIIKECKYTLSQACSILEKWR